MRKKPKLRFVDALPLSELYCEQYRDQNLCLSQTQNDYLFRDFVWQYTSTLYWEGKFITPVINLDLIGY